MFAGVFAKPPLQKRYQCAMNRWLVGADFLAKLPQAHAIWASIAESEHDIYCSLHVRRSLRHRVRLPHDVLIFETYMLRTVRLKERS